MEKIYRNYFIIIIFLTLFINVSAQEQQSIDGIWRSGETGYFEFWGEYQILNVLTIQDGRYTWVYERISEKAAFAGETYRGAIMINDNEIIFSSEERLGAWSLDWQSSQKAKIFSFSIENNVMTLTQGHEVIILTKN